jgi:serine/threonine-protein kinase HipA
LKLDEKQQKNIFKKMEKAKLKLSPFIEQSFLDSSFKLAYQELINERFARIYI